MYNNFKSHKIKEEYILSRRKIMSKYVIGIGICLLLNGVAFKSEAANITSIKPASGTVGTIITVEGEGYSPSETVRIDLTNQFMAAKTECSQEGKFITNFVLGNLPYGKAKFVVIDFEPPYNYNEGFIDVKGNLASTIPSVGTVGTLVTLSGNGYAEEEDIQVDFGDMMLITQKADKNGAFGIVFSVPSQSAGSKLVTIKGLKSNQSHQTRFNIQGNIKSMMPTYGKLGSVVTISGTGFGNKEPIKIDFGNIKDVVDVKSDEQGNWTADFEVDAQAGGRKTVSVRGLLSGEKGESVFVVMPGISFISPISGVFGTQITIKGSGYSISEPIRIDIGRTLGISRVQTDGQGMFEAVFPLDAQPRGTGRIAAVGLNSRKVDFTDKFEVLSVIAALRPELGPVGTGVLIQGYGFPINEEIRIDLGMNITSTIVTTDNRKGSFETNLIVETQPAGQKDVVVTTKAAERCKAQFNVQGKIRLVSPAAGCAGNLVEIMGDGYGASEEIRVDFEDIEGVGLGKTDEKGCFRLNFMVDKCVGGKKAINVIGIASGQKDTYQFLVNSKLVVSPACGTTGTIVNILGNGYGVTEAIRVDCGKMIDVVRGQTDEKGSFDVEFKIDDKEPVGILKIVGIGLKTYRISNANFIVNEAIKEEMQEQIPVEIKTEGEEKKTSE